MFVGYLVGWLS